MKLCSYCCGDATKLEMALETIQKQNELIERYEDIIHKLKGQCLVRKVLDKYFTGNQQKCYKKPLRYFIMTHDDYFIQMKRQTMVKMITITFDPAKFKSKINDSDSQRDYILTILGKMFTDNLIGPFFGCFELHQNGRTHSHIATSQVSPKFLSLISEYFTDNSKNDKAVMIHEKNEQAAYDYITKQETKDPDYDEHYFYTNYIESKNQVISVEGDIRNRLSYYDPIDKNNIYDYLG